MLVKTSDVYEPHQQQEPRETPKAAAAVPSYSSQALFHGQKEILIDHHGCSYRLRITRSGGMILNK
ncbi:hemin uptake protein HemP [Aestuariivirga sp.]|uniref:hemin uptake protein HemP n=1 Tax=Aestuariivirga sp. TaxID=2650926 RepID=UPI0039E3869A